MIERFNPATGEIEIFESDILKGERGDPGIGIQGPPGQSIVGPMGPQGPRGEKGDSIQGPRGFTGKTGAPGRNGIDGIRGSIWFQGSGEPKISNALKGDKYLDVQTGDVYEFQ